jgi:hypothetical protein
MAFGKRSGQSSAGRGRPTSGSGKYGYSSSGSKARSSGSGSSSSRSRSSSSLKTRTNSSGYRQFKDPSSGSWELTHRRVAEKKIGGPIHGDRQVHHIDGNKQNNKPSNLKVVNPREHREIHKKR